MFDLVQLCQITLALAQLSLREGCTSWFRDGGQGSSGNHALALKWLFNFRSSICSNPSSRFLHQCSSQNEVFINPHSPGKQLSLLTPGLEANLHTCWEASLASNTSVGRTVCYKGCSQRVSVPADIGRSFVWLGTNSAFSSCLFAYVKERLGSGIVKLRCLGEDNVIEKADPDELLLKYHFDG